MKSIGETLKRLVPDGREPLPAEAQCPVCLHFDIGNPDVKRILRARDPTGKMALLVQARCRCADLRTSKEKSLQIKGVIRRQQANLPHPQNPRTFDNFLARPGTDEMTAAARLFVDRQGPKFLVFTGAVGTGKSHMLEAIGRACLDQQRSVRYELLADLIDRLRHASRYSYDDSQQDVHDLLEWYASMDTLLLDDQGVERNTPFAEEKAFQVMDERLRNGKRLAIATNSVYEDMVARMGLRISSRLFTDNPALDDVAVIRVTATNYRL